MEPITTTRLNVLEGRINGLRERLLTLRRYL